MTRVLFVCTGNICRSPTAEAVARHFIQAAGLADAIEVDSAGTNGYHAGEAPDPRTRKVAQLRGYDLADLRARKLEVLDFQRFDLVLAMDRGHLEIMQRLGNQKAAYAAFTKALEIHPQLADLVAIVERMRPDVVGREL